MTGMEPYRHRLRFRRQVHGLLTSSGTDSALITPNDVGFRGR
jgi:hypothetical protein